MEDVGPCPPTPALDEEMRKAGDHWVRGPATHGVLTQLKAGETATVLVVGHGVEHFLAPGLPMRRVPELGLGEVTIEDLEGGVRLMSRDISNGKDLTMVPPQP